MILNQTRTRVKREKIKKDFSNIMITMLRLEAEHIIEQRTFLDIEQILKFFITCSSFLND